jgi:dihydroorotate dehydrogenase (NAD+) catalytic subunit
MLNSIGLENVGIDTFLREKLPAAAALPTKIVVSVGGHAVPDYVELARRLDPEPGVAAIELNLSCPNVSGGLDLSLSRAGSAEVVGAVRRVTTKPLIAKLTPNVTAIGDIARGAEEGGADAVSLVNTFIGMAIDVERRTPKLRTVTGGLSGPAIRPLAVAKVYAAARAVRIPVIGIGGVSSAADVIEFLLAGATAVQIGTANFVRPGAAVEILEELTRWLAARDIGSVRELIGALEIPAREAVR